MIAQPSFALTGYDHAMYFIQGIKKQGRNFAGNSSIVGEQPVQTPPQFNTQGPVNKPRKPTTPMWDDDDVVID